MLALVGIGLDSKDISIKALEYIKSADIVLADRYTSIIDQEALDFIEKETGKQIKEIRRSDLEDNLKQTVARAKKENTAILIIGDPLVATTHHIILDEAAKQGVKTRVFHAPSVFSAAIGESGLDIYRFGPTTTIPFWTEKYKPRSFMDVIERNMKNSQHTLLLFDINQKERKPMELDQALDIIKQAQPKKKVLKPDKKVVLIGDIGRETQRIVYAKFSKLEALQSKFKGKTLSIIVPSEPNFAEEDALIKFPSL